MQLTAIGKVVPIPLRSPALRKTYLMFKFTAILLLAGCLQLSATGYGQQITLSKKQATLGELFLEIHHQTNYYFYYDDALLRKAKRVDIFVKQASIKTVLDICFNNQPLHYEIKDGIIVVTSKKDHVYSDTSIQQIRGQVINESDEPMMNVTVKLIPGNILTMTDAMGNFIIPKTAKVSYLEVSSIGYTTRQIALGESKSILIRLKRVENKLDEVQVIAYGTATRRYSTGNVAKVSSEEIARQPVSNPLSAMQGRVAGLNIQQNTGVTGGGFSVQLRGQNSIRPEGNNLFYLVDGVPIPSSSIASLYTSNVVAGGNPLSALNPADIESIEILKDAEATAIYGARGANGVVLITTKKGKSGKTQIDVNSYIGWGKVARKMELLSTKDYLQMRKEAFRNDGEQPQWYDYDLTEWDSSRYTDWQKELIGGTAQIQQTDLSISGGNEFTNILVSGSYRHETTVFPGDFSDRKGSFHFSGRHQSKDHKFQLAIGASFNIDRNNLVYTDLLSTALTLSPNAPAIYNEDGSLNWAGSTWTNPLSYTRQTYLGITKQLLSNISLSYKFSKDWNAKITGGYTSQRLEEDNLQPSASFNPIWGIPGFAMFSTSEQNTWVAEPQVNYNHQWGKLHLDAMAGLSLQETRREGQRIDARNFTSDAVIGNPAAAGTVSIQDVNETRYRYASAYTRWKFDWNSEVLLSLTARKDASSRFGPGKQAGWFGAVGAGWIISQAEWFPKKVLSFAKLRVSYGTTGNDQIEDYGYLSLWRFTYYPYDGIPGLQPQNLANPDYHWERSKKAELGLDLGAWKDRLLLSVSYYINRSDNQLLGYPLPLITGFPSVQYNLPALLQNSGWEFEVNSINVQKKNFSWTSSANISIPRSKLISFPGLEGSAYGRDYVIGEPINIRRSLHGLGVDPVSGLYQFDDTDKNGLIQFPADAQTFKDLYAKAFAGLSNHIKYKGWDLDIFFQAVLQDGYTFQPYFPSPGMPSNQPEWVINRWEKPGDNVAFQRYTQAYGSEAYSAFSMLRDYGDAIIDDASYIRLKNVALSYSLPARLLAKLHCQQWQFYAQGQNLATITNYKGLDPETMRYRNLQPLKVWTIGTKFIF